MQARLCGIDGSFQVRTLLDKPIDAMLSKSTFGPLLSEERLGGVAIIFGELSVISMSIVQICCSAHSAPARLKKNKNKHRLHLVLNINEPLTMSGS